MKDSDCGVGAICQCGGAVGTCVTAACTSDADCPSGSLCATTVTSFGTCGAAPVAYACQTTDDACLTDADCASADSGASTASTQCGLDTDHHRRTCGGGPVACPGRPFLVAGVARVAEVVARGDWCAPVSAPAPAPAPSVRSRRVAAYWSEVAQLEHASIAAFARFALELLALGAPAELIVGTHEAMADETEHARLAFALASTYAGRSIGPGPLAVVGSLDAVSPRGVFASLVREGCVGETVAAVLATEAAAAATPGQAARAALERIGRDETRHAALAWRAARWLVEGGDAAFRAWAEDELARAIADHRSAPDAEPVEPWMRSHGLVDERTRRDLDERLRAEILAPHARALFQPATLAAA